MSRIECFPFWGPPGLVPTDDALPAPSPRQRGAVPLQPLADHDEILTRAEWLRTEEYAEMQRRRDARFEADMKQLMEAGCRAPGSHLPRVLP